MLYKYLKNFQTSDFQNDTKIKINRYKMLTGTKDTDKVVLANLDDWDLVNMCSTNKYFNEICKDDSFWRNRTLARFGAFLGDVEEMKKYMSARKLSTWRAYYVYLIDFLEKVYDGKVSVNIHRNPKEKKVTQAITDIDLLKRVIDQNNSDFLNNVEEYTLNLIGDWEEDENGNIVESQLHDLCKFLDNELKKDMLNPNVLFEQTFKSSFEGQAYEVILRCMFKSKDKRIRPTYKNNVLLRGIAADEDYFLEVNQNTKTFKFLVDDPRIDPNILLLKNFNEDEEPNILVEYLPILANSGRIRRSFYPTLLFQLINVTEGKDEEEKYEGTSFKEFLSMKFNSIFSELEKN